VTADQPVADHVVTHVDPAPEQPAQSAAPAASEPAASPSELTGDDAKTFRARNRNFLVQSLASQYGLSGGEAEYVFDNDPDGTNTEKVVEDVRGQRTLYRQRYEQIDPALGHAGVVADANRASLAAEQSPEARTIADIPGDLTAPTNDAAMPAAGPYGPYADYGKATVTESEIAERTGVDPASNTPVKEG
jgi:hypothetical protein